VRWRRSAPDHAPFDFGLLPGDADEYIITSGAFTGRRGFFTRDDNGAVTRVDLAGLGRPPVTAAVCGAITRPWHLTSPSMLSARVHSLLYLLMVRLVRENP
jgi:hypothetical protein